MSETVQVRPMNSFLSEEKSSNSQPQSQPLHHQPSPPSQTLSLRADSTTRTTQVQPAGSSPQQQQRQASSATTASSSSVSPPPSSTASSPSPDSPLILPKFKKFQRNIDHSAHVGCCDKNPPDRLPSAESGQLAKNSVGLHGFASVHNGTRDHMEDRHRIAYGRHDGLYRAFFGVFDGHGGEEASHFTSQNLHGYVEDELDATYRNKMGLPPPPAANEAGENGTKTRADYSLDQAQLANLNLDYKGSLLRAFDRLEESVLRQSRQIGCRDGTTVTSVLVTHDTIYCCNTGDSRTVLCRDGSAVPLSTDHKPSSDSERARIVEAGGEVRAVMLDRKACLCFAAKKVPHGAERLWPGGFSVSRAVGDIDYKDLRRKKASVVNVLIHRPDVTMTSISSRDQFIICGSDGLWDVVTNQQACDFVLKELKKKKVGESCADIAQKLADYAYSVGSEDNITALVMFFVDGPLTFKA